jgi:hypothetical protein
MSLRTLVYITLAPLATLCGQSDGDPGAGNPTSAAQVAFEALEAEYSAAQKQYFRPFDEANSDADREKVILDPAQDPGPRFAPRFVDLAEEHSGSPAAVAAWMWVIQVGGRSPRSDKSVRTAIDTLIEEYRDHPALTAPVKFAFYSGPIESTVRLLEGLWKRSERDETRAAAGYGLARLAISGLTPGEATRERARSLFEQVQTSHGEVVFHGERTYRQQIDGDLFELRQLVVGKIAPEISGEDLEGERFTLSEYRGRVILLQFWGDW